jgi:TolB protein
VIVLVAASAWSLPAQWDHRSSAVKGIANGVYLEEFEPPVMGAGPTDPAPAPDGRTVAIAARGWLWLLDVTTGEARRASRAVRRRTHAPPGRRTAVASLSYGTMAGIRASSSMT